MKRIFIALAITLCIACFFTYPAAELTRLIMAYWRDYGAVVCFPLELAFIWIGYALALTFIFWLAYKVVKKGV